MDWVVDLTIGKMGSSRSKGAMGKGGEVTGDAWEQLYRWHMCAHARPVQVSPPVSFPSTPHLSVEMPSPPFCSYPGAHIKEHTGSDFADSWKSAAGVQGSLGPPVTPAGNFAYAWHLISVSRGRGGRKREEGQENTSVQ